jgi:hypothetical protein
MYKQETSEIQNEPRADSIPFPIMISRRISHIAGRMEEEKSIPERIEKYLMSK